MKKSTQKRFAPKLKIKKGDKVVVIAGAYRDRSRVLEVLEVLPETNRPQPIGKPLIGCSMRSGK